MDLESGKSVAVVVESSSSSKNAASSDDAGGGRSEESQQQDTTASASQELSSVTEESPTTPLVPNFRVEGGGSGDSSVTVGVASLTCDVVKQQHLSSSKSSPAHVGGGGDDADVSLTASATTNSASVVSSSDEMKLSLVSWYSEPEDPCRLPGAMMTNSCGGGAGGGSGSTMNGNDEGGRASSGHGNYPARQAMSMTASMLRKSYSEEKENCTPEPVKTNGSSHLVDDRVTKSTKDKIEDRDKKKRSTTPTSIPTPNTKNKQSSNNSKESKKTNNKSTTSSSKKPGSNSMEDLPKSKVPKKIPSSTPLKTPTPESRNRIENVHPLNYRNSPVSKTAFGRSVLPKSAPPRTQASRRLMPSTKSSAELKKPIKSILKGGGGSGSGSENNKSSMDSLTSADGRPLIGGGGSTTSSSSVGQRTTKFHLNHKIFTPTDAVDGRNHVEGERPSTPVNDDADRQHVVEDRLLSSSKIRRIEKYATLRLRKGVRVRPLDFGCSDPEVNVVGSQSGSGATSKASTPSTDLMTKSMTFLEKSSSTPRRKSRDGEDTPLKRQGSQRKGISGFWEPNLTKTTALRLQKMQEAKAKRGEGGGSTHSGSGESIHNSGGRYLHHTTTPVKSVFAKLSSAQGQTASSKNKRLRQERGVQTDPPPPPSSLALSPSPSPCSTETSTPTPTPPRTGASAASGDSTDGHGHFYLDKTDELLEEMKRLEVLSDKYKSTALRFQAEFEKSETQKTELKKQLKEVQAETNETIDFLQAEKSTLADTLSELEVEAKEWREKIQSVSKDAEARCSTLVRLSEQHKQEALKSQTLLKRLELQSGSLTASFSGQLSDGSTSVRKTTDNLKAVTESLIIAYKIPQDVLNSFAGQKSKLETEPNSSLLLPLIASLAKGFAIDQVSSPSPTSSCNGEGARALKEAATTTTENEMNSATTAAPATSDSLSDPSLQNLNRAIMEREAAEEGLEDQIDGNSGSSLGDDKCTSNLAQEINDLNSSIAKLLLVVRVIIVQCDKKVNSVTSSILQCLESMKKDDQKGNQITEIIQVQKSLEAWRDSQKTQSSS